MKTNLILIIAIAFLSATTVNAQDSRLLKASDKSFDNGEQNYSKKRWTEASESLEIVVENIPVSVDSRKYLIMRFEANVMLIDIYFNRTNNLPAGCKSLNAFLDDINYVKKLGVFRAKDIFKYLELEKEYAQLKVKCDSFGAINSDKKAFEKKFDEEFGEEEEE